MQYDFAKDLSNDPSWRDVLEKAQGLLYAMVHRREDVETRPIVWICHSFGALILKKVRCQTSC